jgi:hypothetical protein
MSNQFVTRSMRRLITMLVLTPGLVAIGCAGGDKPASVSGKVTYNGKPVTSGTVVLIGEGKNSDPGAVQADGTYAIARAPLGRVKVAFDNPPPVQSRPASPAQKNDPEFQEQAQEAARYVKTPEKYKDPDQSGLSFELRRGKNTCDIDLK